MQGTEVRWYKMVRKGWKNPGHKGTPAPLVTVQILRASLGGKRSNLDCKKKTGGIQQERLEGSATPVNSFFGHIDRRSDK